MLNYRVYYQNQANHIMGADTVTADDDAGAIAVVEQLCDIHPHCRSVELWHLKRQVHAYRRIKVAGVLLPPLALH
jgi:hypothetical protein